MARKPKEESFFGNDDDADSSDDWECLLDEDEISPEEEAFMRGYEYDEI